MQSKIEIRRYTDETRDDRDRRIVDHFYTLHGPCCAGCDFWSMANVLVGECTRSAPVSGQQRWSMMRVHAPAYMPDAGHIITPREHRCGDFKDDFDWSSLPLIYLKRIGRQATGEKSAKQD